MRVTVDVARGVEVTVREQQLRSMRACPVLDERLGPGPEGDSVADPSGVEVEPTKERDDVHVERVEPVGATRIELEHRHPER